MQVRRKAPKPAAKFVLMIACALGAALVLHAWGGQLQADCLPHHGTACADNVVADQLAFGFTVFAVGLIVVGLAMALYTVGVNGYLADLQAQAGQPAGKRRR